MDTGKLLGKPNTILGSDRVTCSGIPSHLGKAQSSAESYESFRLYLRLYFPLLLLQGPGASECTTCEAGHYCDSRTTSKAEMIGTKICPAGTHCPPGTVEKPDLHESTYSCWKGHYCLRGDEVQLVDCCMSCSTMLN